MELHLEMTDGGLGDLSDRRGRDSDDENRRPEQPSGALGDRETRLRGRPQAVGTEEVRAAAGARLELDQLDLAGCRDSVEIVGVVALRR